ncbi:MAG: anthranilate synthase component I family protein [Desulfovibrionaceae bacterium]
MPWNHSVLPEHLTRRQFQALALGLARERYADLFLSGPGFPGEDRSFAGLEPVSELTVTPDTPPGRIADFCFGTPGTALGWLGYELGLRLRGVASAKTGDLPQGVLRKYASLLEHDAASGAVRVHGAPIRLEPDTTPRTAATFAPGSMGPAFANLDREAYMERVRQTLEHIRGGHTYQLNLSLRFEAPAPDLDSLAWFAQLLERNPAPFYAFFRFGTHSLLSTSPERFLRVRQGEVLTQPIKGTLRIAPGSEPDPAPLLASAKEDAELSMIVDLMRNDISRHCDYGSVRVERHKHVFRVDNLLQMQSDVRGKLRQGSTCLDLLLDAFPGGSVTGCPKRRSLRLIDELEPHSRGPYCGSFLIVEDERNMDSSVAIRTAHHDASSGVLAFWAGSGIVVDSDPESEYLESVAKAEKFLQHGARQP